MKPNSLEYQKSIALEFESYKNRVRYLIGSCHWGEEGRYKETILSNFLKRFLPSNIKIGTGFIKTKDDVSTQIDIIIYDSSVPLYFKENDFVIIPPEGVMGIIEVKSNPNLNEIAKAIFKANKIGELVETDLIFNGIFIFGEASENKYHSSKLLKRPTQNSALRKSLLDSLSHKNSVNHIASNEGIFIKKWIDLDELKCYRIEKLAASYFFSNLLNMLSEKKVTAITTMHSHLYPISEGKREYQKWSTKDFN